ncbi:hypothetical protein AMR72_08925 [Flavobacterium psychrophilum]|nr:hypothetical protein AMR72_08925 [Flavobacterium psychrophilum]AOE52618.1 hypothetical protein ALW18_08915 [Flavobacterium psychrophilum]
MPVNFSKRKQYTIKGDMTMIANNIVNRNVNGSPNNSYNTTGDNSSYNDNVDMYYIDIDNDNSTTSSSKATLSIPDPLCSKVVYAALYWSATYANTSNREDITKIKFKVKNGAYQNITGNVIYNGYNTPAFGSNGVYACYADVTSYLSTLTNPNGEYTVANIKSSQGKVSGGVSGGWTLFVIYENPSMPGKYITSFDGFAGVHENLGAVNIDYNGFITVPAPQPVNAKMIAAALEGDNRITGDRLRIKAGNSTGFTTLKNDKNPQNNFFNSSITVLDALDQSVNFSDRTPKSVNTLGYDSDIIKLDSGVIPNSATSATVEITSSGDSYYMFFNALSIDVIEPDITIVKTVQRPSGENWAGKNVDLGWVLQYKLTFNNTGKDDAHNFTIKDVLPPNTSLRSVNFSDVPDASYVPGAVPGEIIISIPDKYVTKESGNGEHYIIIEVKVAENCNDFTDACANRIANIAYATYSGIKNSNVISDDPSVAGIGACNRPEEGPANFIVDISRCEFRRSEIICGGTLNISAGAGYGQYEWYLKDPGGNTANDIPMGNTQQITVTVPGEYYVKTTPIAPCLVGTEEYITVKNFNDLSLINPVAAVADKEERCENNNLLIPKIFLCGFNDSRFIPSNISSGTVRWQKLDKTAPGCNVSLPDPCPQNQCMTGWNTVFTGPNYTVENDGEYRIEVDQNGCRSYYYFKVSKNLLNPTIEVKDVICGNPGEIKVLGVPAQNYQIRLLDQDTGTVLVDYPNTNPVFPVSALGVYTVEIKQTDVPAGSIGCEFKLKDIGVQSRAIRVVPVVTDKTCVLPGSITLRVLDVKPEYTYLLKGGPNNIQIGPIGPQASNIYSFDDLLPGSYYVEVTTDDCTYTNTFVINDYSNPQITAYVRPHVSCDPGLVNFEVTGGKSPFTYAIYSFNDVLKDPQLEDYILINPAEVELAEIGKYVFIVKDANGCTAISEPVIIENVPGVKYTYTSQNILCQGGTDGSITFAITATGAHAISFELVDPLDPETILKTNATGQFTGLTAGDYIVNVVQTGSNNTCKFPVNFTITEPAALVVGAATVIQQYTCTTTATISFDASTVSGGTAPYTYSINGTAFAGTTTFTGLTAGTYKVTVKDASGCTIQTPAITVDPLTPVTAITFTATDVECPSLTSDVTLAATGGFGALTYKIIAPAGKEVDNTSNPLFTGLDADTYTFEVTDAKGCVYTQNYVIDPITPVTVTAQKIKDIECLGDTNGSLTFTVGGAATYDYTVIATGPGTAVPAVTGETNATITITDLAAGTYTVTVQDPVTKCTDDATITIDAPLSALSVTETVVQPTCTTGGSITVNATNGWGNYTYILSNGTTTITQSNPEFTDLANGTYELEVKDLNGCPYSATITLNAAVSPVVSIVTASTDLCYDADGASATVAVNAGTGKAPFRYSINGGTTYQASETFAGLVPGSYTITVLDANNCTDDVQFDINNRLLVSGDLKTAFDCEPAPDNRAVVEATITGGKAPYKYQVSNSNLNGGAYGSLITAGSATVTLDIAPADFGDYKIKIIDAAGCTVETSAINVPQLSQPEITLLKPTNILCNGASTGAIQVDIDTTKGLAPYVINVSTATHDYGTQTTGLPAGDYTVKVTDSNGCSVTDTASITELPAITFLTTEDNIRCIEDPDNPGTNISAGKIRIHTVAGGTAPYTYELTNNFGYSAVPVTTSTASHEFIILNYGIYQVVIKDANGCTAVKQNIIMASPPNQLDINIDTTWPSTCAGGGKAVVTVGAAITSDNYEFAILETNEYPYSTDWKQADDPDDAPRTASFTGLVPGVIYTFVVYDKDTRCHYFETAKITDVTPSDLVVNILAVNDVACKGAGNGNVIFNFSGFDSGASQVTYQVYRAQSNTAVTGIQDATLTPSGTITDTLTGLTPGVYYIQFQEVGGLHAGCKMASAQFTITESVNELLVNAEAKNANCNPNSGEITITGQGGAGDYSYQVVIDGAPQPTTWVSTNMFKRNSGNYDAYIKDANNCIVKADIFVPLDATPVVTASVATQCNTEDGSYTINVARTSNASPAPFTYSINGAAFQAKADTFTYDNLTSGTYQIRIKDGNGCIFQAADVIIHEPLDLMASVSTQPTCDDNDGEITVTGIGGSATANYEYELQGAVTVAAQPSNIFTGLKAGDYTVIIHDTTTNCTAQADVTLEKAIEVDFTLTKTDVICNGGNTGTVTAKLDVTSTDLPYTYSIANVAGTYTHNNVNNPVFTGLEADDYIVTVTSGKKCTKDVAITVGEPDALVANATATAFECATDNTVKTSLVTITATGGKGTYRYSRDGSNYITSNTFEVIDNGSTQSVTVYVKDANNCVNSYNFNIDPLPAMGTFTLNTVTAMTCTNDALVEVAVSGGSGNFKFEMLPSGTLGTALPVPDVRKSRFTLTEVGTYTFKVTDLDTDCTKTLTHTIAPFNTIEVEAVSATAVNCYGASDGSITINVSGYTGAYNYEVYNGTTNVASGTGDFAVNPFEINGVPAGNLFVRIIATDTPFCSADTAIITVPSPAEPLNLPSIITANVTCSNDKGEISAQAKGGWGTYQYKLERTIPFYELVQDFDFNSAFTALEEGSYTLTVKDSSGCEYSETVDLVRPTPITANIIASDTDVSCYGDGGITVQATNVSGGRGVYQYALNTYDIAGTAIATTTGGQTSPVFTDLRAGIYSIIVTDGWSCDVETTKVTINQPEPLVVGLSLDKGFTCDTDAQLIISATGGTAPYRYSTTVNGTYTAFTNGDTSTIDITASGTYKYLVKDANDCTAVFTNSVAIPAVQPINIKLNFAGAVINCAGENSAEISAVATAGLGNYEYALYNVTANTTTAYQPSGVFPGLSKGTYRILVKSGDCDATSADVIIEEPEPFVVTPQATDIVCFGEVNGKITITTTGGTGKVQYAISPNLNEFVDTNVFQFLKEGFYDVIAQDANGCFEIHRVEIKEPKEIEANVTKVTNETCLGANDGTIAVSIKGGTGDYVISLDENGPYVPVTGSTYLLEGLPAGTSTIYVKDENGCSLNPPIDNEILQGVDLQPSAEVSVTCDNNTPANNVTITINSAVDTTNVEYSIDGTTYQPSNEFLNVSLAAGTHTAHIRHTDGDGLICIKTDDFVLTDYDALTATADVTTEVLCYGEATGKITVTASYGTAPIKFAISDEVAPVFVDSDYGIEDVFENLPAGNYTISVKDSIGCEIVITKTIIEPTAALIATAVSTNEICIGANDGTITITAQDGSGPYESRIRSTDAFSTDMTYTDLTPGSYTVEVKDANRLYLHYPYSNRDRRRC